MHQLTSVSLSSCLEQMQSLWHVLVELKNIIDSYFHCLSRDGFRTQSRD